MLDDIAGEEHGLQRIDSRFREQADEPQNPVVQAVIWMLGYRFVEASDASARSRYGVPFAPAMEWQERVFPPYLDQLPDREGILAIWAELAGLVRHPVIKARASDLLWCIQSGGNRHQHARNAIEAYLSAAAPADTGEADNEWLLDAARGLGRALELSLAINAPELAGRVRDRITHMLQQELQAEDAGSRPGVWMGLLCPLVDLDPDERPSELSELLEQGHAMMADRPNVRLSLYQMEEQVARGEQDVVRRIGRSAVAMLIMHARRQASGLAKQHWLMEALDRARARGLGARTEHRIRKALPRIDPDSIDWQEHSFAIDIPREEVEQRAESIVGDDGIERALERFALGGGSPVGDRAETERTVDELAQQFVFKNLVTRAVADERGYQIRLAASAEDKRSLDILEHEARSIQIDALLREFALDRIGERYSTDRASLHQLFETELIDEQQADAFARALEHYWADRPDEALLICLPRIEAVLRRWLDAAGGVVYQPPRGHRPGRVLGLGDVLRGLEELATDAMADRLRFFRIALTEQVPGLNLRNRHVHGLAEQASKRDAAVVLMIAALLRLAPIWVRRPG